jgi:hypothetical protein
MRRCSADGGEAPNNRVLAAGDRARLMIADEKTECVFDFRAQFSEDDGCYPFDGPQKSARMANSWFGLSCEWELAARLVGLQGRR